MPERSHCIQNIAHLPSQGDMEVRLTQKNATEINTYLTKPMARKKIGVMWALKTSNPVLTRLQSFYRYKQVCCRICQEAQTTCCQYHIGQRIAVKSSWVLHYCIAGGLPIRLWWWGLMEQKRMPENRFRWRANVLVVFFPWNLCLEIEIFSWR